MELINYDSFTTDQLKTIKDNIDRRSKNDNLMIAPPTLYMYKSNKQCWYGQFFI